MGWGEGNKKKREATNCGAGNEETKLPSKNRGKVIQQKEVVKIGMNVESSQERSIKISPGGRSRVEKRVSRGLRRLGENEEGSERKEKGFVHKNLTYDREKNRRGEGESRRKKQQSLNVLTKGERSKRRKETILIV